MKAVISAKLLTSAAAQPKPKPFEIADSRLPGFTLRVQPSGARSYVARYDRDKRKTICRVGVMTPDEARERAQRIIGNHANGRELLHGLTLHSEPANKTTLRRFIEDTWLEWAKVNRRKSWYNTHSAVRVQFVDWLDLPVASITPELIEKWATSKLAAGGKPTSVRRNCDALAGILTRAVKEKVIDASPMRQVEKPKLDRNPRVRFLSIEEERRLRVALTERDLEMIAARDRKNEERARYKQAQWPRLVHFGDHLTPAVLLSLATGMRRGELLRLRWRDIDSVITLEETKGVDTRHQPITPEARQVLKKIAERFPPASRDAYVLPVRHHTRKSWLAVLKRAKIAGFRWNDLRHSFASSVLQEGAALNTVRDLLGHKELRTTLRYAHLAPSDKESAVALLTRRLAKVNAKR